MGLGGVVDRSCGCQHQNLGELFYGDSLAAYKELSEVR